MTTAKIRGYKFGTLVPSLDLLSSENGTAEVYYCIVISEKNKDVFNISDGDIMDAELVTAYDSGWTWLPPYNVTSNSNAQDSSDGISQNDARSGKNQLIVADYKASTKISIWHTDKRWKF